MTDQISMGLGQLIERAVAKCDHAIVVLRLVSTLGQQCVQCVGAKASCPTTGAHRSKLVPVGSDRLFERGSRPARDVRLDGAGEDFGSELVVANG